MSDIPICPRCGAQLIMRTSSKGSYKGNKFWGCPNWKKLNCKTIINIDENLKQNTSNKNGDYELPDEDYGYLVPVFLQSREKFQGYQTKFYQSISIPFSILKMVNKDILDRKAMNRLNQWRIDYPIGKYSIEQCNKRILIMANKILTRGRLTLPSPFIEREFEEHFKVNQEIENFNIDSLVSHIKYNDTSNIWLDGIGYEKKFYEEFLPKHMGSNYRFYVLSQVALSSLVPLKDEDKISLTSQRVDFLISTPEKNIVVELDGDEHENHKEVDSHRDNLLIKNGYEVIRIKNNEIRDGIGKNIDKFIKLLDSSRLDLKFEFTNYEKSLIAFKVSHQIQVSIVESLLSGIIDINNPIVYIDLFSNAFEDEDICQILKTVENDLMQLIRNLCKLFGTEGFIENIRLRKYENNTNCTVISYNENLQNISSKIIIQDISFSKLISQPSRTIELKFLPEPSEENLEFFLNYIFRKQSFREGQYETIARSLQGKDTIVLLPTGSGKSIAFQLSAILMPGVAVVIDPIVSLVEDQIENLYRIGIDRVMGITSLINNTQVKSAIINAFGMGEYLLCYIAPERFQTEEFRNAIKSLTTCTPIPLVAIDEAHCVSEWGHDFRTSYLNIGRTSRNYCGIGNKNPCLVALTGTASNTVLRDVQRELQITDYNAIITPKTFDRKELNYHVIKCSSGEKNEILSTILKRYLPDKFMTSDVSFFSCRDELTNGGLVFCPHTNGAFGVVDVANDVLLDTGVEARYYSGQSPKKILDKDWTSLKRKVAKDFKNNKFSLLVSTKAFGMGIDKPNIRYTIHYGIPGSIESFYQEAGRAGRDGNPSTCVIILSNDEPIRSKKLLDLYNKIENIEEIMKTERNFNSDDDVTRAMYFHLMAFKGVNGEIADIDLVINQLGDLTRTKKINIIIGSMDRNSIEKALYRLVVLGVVLDYTITYANNEFHVTISGLSKDEIIDKYKKYVFGYNKTKDKIEVSKLRKFEGLEYHEFIKSATKTLISFIYDTIEKGRRHKLSEMLNLAQEAAKSDDPNDVVRERVLRYLESTYTVEIEKILNEDNLGFNAIKDLLDGYDDSNTGELFGGLRSPKDAAEIRGQVSRYLESTPDHPGLLIVRALSELFCLNYDEQVVLSNIHASVKYAKELIGFSIEAEKFYELIAWVSSKIFERNELLYSEVICDLLYSLEDIQLAKNLIELARDNNKMIYEPGTYILGRYAEKIDKILNRGAIYE